MPPSTFERIPGEVLHKIAVFVGGLTFLGPPSDVRSMILLSKKVSEKVSWNHVHAAIFRQKFDESAPVRRLGKTCKFDSALAAELAKRFGALKRLKNDAYLDFDAETLRLDLWTAYLMFLESEEKNAKQLVEYSRVDSFALNYVSREGRLHDGANENSGLIVDSENNALALSLFWFTDRDRVKSEPQRQRRAISNIFFWIFFASLKYPATTFPLTKFHTSATGLQIRSAPRLIDGSLTRPPGLACTIPDHFGFKLTVTRPSISLPAYLSTAVRSEAMNADDLRSIEAALVEWGDERSGTSPGSKSYDADWGRLRPSCKLRSQPMTIEHAAFKPGTLHGKWVGRWFHPRHNLSVDWRAEGPALMTLRIREHHQNRKEDVLGYDDISHDGTGSGPLSAWLPRNTTMAEVGNDLLVYDPNTQQSSKYRTYYPDAAADHDANEDKIPREDRGLYGGTVHDVLLTAQSEESYGETWEHDRFEGRVREIDGLVMLVERRLQCIFYGEVHGGRNIVGRWKFAGSNVQWSGVWCMTKEGE